MGVLPILSEFPALALDISGNTVWKVSGAGKLHWRCWDGDYVVFNPLSGDTHLLDIVAGGVLMNILAGPSTTDALTRKAAAFLEVDSGEDLSSYVKDIIVRLDGLGLIEPVPGC